MAGANVRQIANDIYAAIRHDPVLVSAKRAELVALATGITAASGAMTITSATVNGQSFSGLASLTASERLRVLRIFDDNVNNGRSTPNYTIGRFA